VSDGPPSGLVITPPARRDLRRLSADDQDRIIKAALGLLQNPPHGDIKKLSGVEGEWRLRVGRWRIRFAFGEDAVIIQRVLPRDQAYRD
jgi:mRNA interferase RelE/StbE